MKLEFYLELFGVIVSLIMMITMQINLASCDILSINNEGSGEFVLIPQEQINNFFSGNPTPTPVVPEVKKNGYALKIEQGKAYKYQYLLLLIGLVVAGFIYSHYKKKKFLIAGKDDDDEKEVEDMEVKNEIR